MRMQCLRSEGSLETGHDQGRPDPLSGHISDCDAPAPLSQKQKVVVIASDVVGGPVKSFARQAGNRQVLRREERLLHILGALQIPAQRPVKSRVRFGLFYVLRERLHMIPQQEAGFSASAFLEGVDNGLVRFNYVAHVLRDLSDYRADSQVDRQSIPYAN